MTSPQCVIDKCRKVSFIDGLCRKHHKEKPIEFRSPEWWEDYYRERGWTIG